MTTSPPLPAMIARGLAICCTVVWIAAFVATHVPITRLPQTEVSDKVLHFVGFFVIAALFLLALAAAGVVLSRRAAMVFFVTVFYGAFDEVTQMLVGRTASVADWVADSLGVVAAILATELTLALFRRRFSR